jgi:amidophosphoribosyltransferase
MDLITHAIIVELEGEEGLKHISEYADTTSQRHKNMKEAIRKKLGLASLEFQSIDGLVKAIGIDKCKLCTYCWEGKEE